MLIWFQNITSSAQKMLLKTALLHIFTYGVRSISNISNVCNRALRSKNSHKFQINMPRRVYFLLIWHFARAIALCWIRFLQIQISFCYAVFEKLDRQVLEITKIGVPSCLKHNIKWTIKFSLFLYDVQQTNLLKVSPWEFFRCMEIK